MNINLNFKLPIKYIVIAVGVAIVIAGFVMPTPIDTGKIL